jgi:hypothetical protein
MLKCAPVGAREGATAVGRAFQGIAALIRPEEGGARAGACKQVGQKLHSALSSCIAVHTVLVMVAQQSGKKENAHVCW